MVKRKRGLGKGLDKLIGNAEKVSRTDVAGAQIEQLPVGRIRPGTYQPRQHFDQVALEALAESIKAQGLVQPVVVRPRDGAYEIIAGERRWRAAQLAGLKQIPVIIRQADDQSTLALALIENLQREDLNPIEQAHGLARLLEEFSLTHEQLAEAVGLSRAQVTNLLRLLKLPAQVQAWVHDGALSMGHARALLPLTESQQILLGQKAIAQGWSVRQTEAAAKNAKADLPSDAGTVREKDPNIVALENRMAEKLGAKVTVRVTPKGRGKVEIHYSDLDELDRLLKLLEIDV
jgi:ParB family chromosome partitioning protein